MSDETTQCIQNNQRLLQERLVGLWAEDTWLVNTRSSTRKAVYLRFTIDSTPLKVEIKYAVWSKFDNRQWKIEKDQKSLRKELSIIIQWLNHFSVPIQSLMEKSLEQWETSLRSYILQTGRLQQRVHKILLSSQEYVERVGDDPRIHLFRKLYNIIQDVYDDQPTLEKDVWDLRKLGLKVNLTATHNCLNFTLISQPWLRDLAKVFMKYSIEQNSAGDCTTKLQAIRGFSYFLASEYQTTSISDIDRSMMLKYISFLKASHVSDHWRKLVLSSLKTFFETCAYRLMIAGITKEPIIFSDDYPKKRKQLSREIPEEVLEQVRKHLETLDATTLRMIVILLECGMRISELCSLPLECLICDDKHEWYLRSFQIKSKREHIIPLINNKVVNVIQAQQQLIHEQWGNACSYLFPSREIYTLPFKSQVFAEKLNKWAVEKNIHDSTNKLYRFQSHQFRHTVGMRLINDNIPLDVISRLLGHSSLEATQIYAHKRATKLREELERVARKRKVVNHLGDVVTEEGHASSPVSQITRRGIRGQTLPIGGCGRPVVSGDCEHANKCLNCTFWLTSTEDIPRLKEFHTRAIRVRQKALECGNQAVVKNQEHIIPNLALRIAKLEDTSMDGSLAVSDLLAQLRTDLMEVENELVDAREQNLFLLVRELERIAEDLKAKITALEGSL